MQRARWYSDGAMTDWLYLIILYPIIFILPAYVANGAPVLFGGGTPIDLNKNLGGKPIFGKHKTIKGLVSGIAAGILIGFAESLFPAYGFMFLIGIFQSVGAHVGDLLGSFIKRQRGVKAGRRFLLDPYLFLVFAILFSIPFGHLPDLLGVAFLLVLTGIMHPLTNLIAHALKLKEVPW